MKRLTRSEIKAELEKPNGSAEIMNDSTIDKISLCDETTAMFIEENIGSALMIRLAKSRAMLLRMSGNPALLPAMRKALANDASPKLRRNAARLIGLFTKDEADAQLLIARLKCEDTRFVRPSLLLHWEPSAAKALSALLTNTFPPRLRTKRSRSIILRNARR